MTIFALCSMAMYARYERLVPSFAPRRSSPLDLPATRTSQISEAKSSPLWAIGSALFAAGALASYEQGVMVPACLLGIAVYYRLLGQRPRWGWQALFWSLLIGYLWVRHSVIPPGESGYQKQQLRSSVAGGVMALTPLFFSPINALGPIITSIESGWLVLFTGQIYANLLTCVSGVTAVYQLRRDWVLALTGWALSILAFLPMAFLKMFEHYYYWPFALRTVFVIALGNVAWKLTSTAWSLPELQAPPRRSPAPGSLPHPSGYSPVS